MQRSPGAIALAVVGTSALVFALTPAVSALASAAAPVRAAASPASAAVPERAASSATSSAASALRLTATQAASLSADATAPVIVFLKDQPPVVSPTSPRSAARRDAIAASQAPFLRGLG